MRFERQTHNPSARADLLVQASELGGRLEHVAAQYERLVRGLAGDEAVSSDFDSRLHLVNRELGQVTRRLQELFVLEYEARLQQDWASTREAARGRRERRQVAALRGIDRRSVVTPFVPAAHRHPVPVMSAPTRIAAGQ